MIFDASDSRTDDGELTGYRWNFGDGTIISGGESANHTYEQTGTYTVTVTVENDDGLNDSAQTTVRVTGLRVDAELQTDRPQTGEPTEVVAQLADARGEPVEGRAVAFVKHTGPGGFRGSPRGGGGEATVEAVSDAEGRASARYQSTETGVAEVLVRAGVAEDRVEFRIDDRAPDAVIDAPDTPVRPNERVEFEAGTPRDSDGTIASREWHVAREGETLASGTGPTFEVDFPAEGDYAISLEVTDESGRTGTATETVAVEERGRASLEVDGPDTLVAGDHGKFDVDVQNPPGAPAEYHWEIDDERKISAAPSVTHTFSQDGRHTIDVAVICESGDVLKNAGSVPFHEVTVVNNRPEVELEASPQRVTPGDTVELYAEASDPDDHGLDEYRWSGVDWS
ncbi:MAG: PKD domain-containing protein, partial [Gemmatimonadota bacterium]